MEDTLIPDLETGDIIINDVVSSQNDDDRSSGPENDYERRGAVGVDSDKSTGEESEEMHRPLEMEKGAENDLEVNGSVATNDVALSQSDEHLINQTGAVGIDSNKSTVEEITEMLKLLKMEEGSGEDLEVNISDAADDVALSQSDDLLIAVSSSSTLVDGQSSGPRKGFELRGGAGVDSDISSGEETKETDVLLEMEASAEKDLEVNGSGAATGATLSQVNDFLINQVEAFGTESDTSIGDDIKKTSPSKDYEMEESAEKDLEVNGSGAANSVTLSQVNDFLINQVGAVGTESDTSIGEDIAETSAGIIYEMEESVEKDFEVNGSGAVSSATLSQVNDLLINQVGAVGTESDTSIVDDIKETSPGKDYEMKKNAEKDLEVKGSGAANSATLSQVNDLLVNQVGAVEMESATSIVEDIEETSAGNDYEMEESAEKDLELNGSGAANSVTLSPVIDLLIDQVGAVGTESATSKGEDIEETRAGNDYEVEESAEKDLEVNESGAASSATLSQVNGLLINQVGAVGTESDTSIVDDVKETRTGKDYEVNLSVATNDVAISRSDDIVINHIGAVGIELNKTTDAEIKEMPKLLAMEGSSGNDRETNISVANNDVAPSQVNEFLINQVGGVGTESDTSIGKDIEETSAGNDYEMEESAEKDLDVSGSGVASSATLSQVNDLLINQVGAVGTESDTSISEDINETNAGKDYEVNMSVAANDVAISHRDDIVINHIGAAGIEFNKTSDAEIKEMPELLAMEESSGNDLETNISVANNDVALSQSDDLLIAVSSSSTISKDQSSDEYITQPQLLEMEESAGKHPEMNRSSAANNVALSLSDDLLINQIGADGIDSNKSTIEEIKEKPKLIEVEQSFGNDLEANISVADNDVTSSTSSELLIAVPSLSTLSNNQSSGEDIKDELLNMEENAGNDLEVNTLSAANDVALSQNTDLLNHNGVVETDFNRSAFEVIKEMPKLPELEEGAVKDPEMNISVADNDVALCQGDDLLITVSSSSSTLSDNQSSGEDTEKMPIVLETKDNAGKDLEMHQLEATNNAALSQSHDALITISSFPSTLSDQQSSGHGNETRPELIGAVEIEADKPGSEETLEMPKLLVTPEPEKCKKNVKFNLRKSLAWDSAFFTSDGVLDADELSTMMEGGVKNAKHQLPGIEEEVYRSMDSISTLESDNLSLECLEAELFEDIRASIQKSNRSSSNLNNSSIKVSLGKKDSQAKASKKVDTDSAKRPAARMKQIPSSIPQPKIVSRVNSSSTLTLTKRASLSANHAKKDQDIARQPHVIQKGTQAARATTQVSKLIGPHRGVPKPSLSSKASPMGSSIALKTEPTRPSSSHSNSSSCSSGTDIKPSTTLSRKKIDSKSSKLTTTVVLKTPSRVIMKNKPQPPANSRVSSHSLSTVSSSISPASSISEWPSESSSSTTNNNRRSESRGSTDTIVSYRSLDNDASGQSASNILPTGRISNQNGNQPISQSGSVARPPCVQPTGLRMPSPKIGFFDGGKSGARTPNGGNIRPQSKLPTGIPKIGATHSNSIISNGVKSGKIPPPKTGAAHTIMKPNPQKAAPKPSQEQPKTKSSLVTSDASNTITDGSRTPFAVKNSEAY